VIDVFPLRAFAAATQEQEGLFSGLSVVHPVAGTNIDLELPYTIPTKLVIAEVGIHEPIEATEDGGLSARISQRPKPFAKGVLVVGGDVMKDFHVIFAYKRMIVKGSDIHSTLTISVYAWNTKRQFNRYGFLVGCWQLTALRQM
jgi:hypothetical protein